MRILFLTHSFNSLAQRLFIELRDRGHEVSVELDISDATTREALDLHRPDLIVAPFLKRLIPRDVFQRVPCLVVHPGIKGDRGPSSLDWAIMDGEKRWGVTVLQATAEFDAGNIWASVEFDMREATKSDLYRREMADAATTALLDALGRFEAGTLEPEPLDYGRDNVRGRLRPTVKQADRAIDWQADTTETVLRKIRAADSRPGILDRIGERWWTCHGAHPEDELRGSPGSIVARRGGAICRATLDGAVWISHLAAAKGQEGGLPFKLPATMQLGDEVTGVPEVPIAIRRAGRRSGYPKRRGQ